MEVFQAPHTVLNSPCKFLMILGILSSSITTSHIPLLNSTCLSAPSKAVHSSGSICLWFFMRVSSQGAWVPFPPVLISYLSCVSLLTCIPTHPSPYLHLSGVPLPPKLLHRAFISTPKNFPLKFFSLWIRESSSLRMCFFKDTFPNTHTPPKPRSYHSICHPAHPANFMVSFAFISL